MAGSITISTLNNDTGVLATQNGMNGIAKAWVNFNGQGTVAIRGSFNVSSITDNGTGDYTINFTTAMPDANYAATTTAGFLDNGNTNSGSKVYSTSTTGVRVLSYAPVASATDFDGFFVIVCGN